MFKFQEAGISIMRSGEFIERSQINGLEASLIAGGNGAEIIYHHLVQGTNWYIGPEDTWDGFEYIFVLSGHLKCTTSSGQTILQNNDSISIQSVKDTIEFTAIEDTSFLYVSSMPVFYHYSTYLNELADLTIIVEQKDGCTAEHCGRIRNLALLVGHQMGLKPVEIVRLHFAAFFHDVGKAKIPDHILGKPGKLTEDEFEEMKKHTIYGKQMLMESGHPVLIQCSPIVEQHHERFNGSGYPYGLKGDEILKEALIVAVVDSFDAIVSNRVYRKGQSKEFAVNEIVRNKGILYSPDVVDSFLKILNDIDCVYQ